MHDEVYNALQAVYAYQSVTGFCAAEVEGWSGFVFKNRYGGVYHEGPINKAIHRVVNHYNRSCSIKNRRDITVPFHKAVAE